MPGTFHIVVGVDGSAGGQRALRWALLEATHRRGTVQAVCAWRPDGPDGANSVGQAMALLDREIGGALADLPVPPPTAYEAVEGRAPRALTQAARDAHVLVLGSHGNGRGQHAALGSVSEECVRYAFCPVVIVPEPHPERELLRELPALRESGGPRPD